MKTVKLLVLPLMALLLCGCNYDLIDTNFTYDKAMCEVNGKYEEIEIKKWTDYEGEQIQIISKDGKTYLMSMNNCTLVKEN